MWIQAVSVQGCINCFFGFVSVICELKSFWFCMATTSVYRLLLNRKHFLMFF